jgi:hypothetical protein
VAQIAGGNDRTQLVVYSNCAATVNAGAVQANFGINTASSVSLAYAYRANDFAVSVGGGTPATDTSGTVPATLVYMNLGRFDFGGAETLNGHIQSLAYYNRRLPNQTIQSLTV